LSEGLECPVWPLAVLLTQVQYRAVATKDIDLG